MSVSARYIYVVIGATLAGVVVGFIMGRNSEPTDARKPNPAPSATASFTPKEAAMLATLIDKERPKDEKPKDPFDASPLHGFLTPMFTVVPMTLCPGRGGAFCPYTSCAASTPETTHPGKLWNAYAVASKDGPAVVCEWRDSL